MIRGVIGHIWEAAGQSAVVLQLNLDRYEEIFATQTGEKLPKNKAPIVVRVSVSSPSFDEMPSSVQLWQAKGTDDRSMDARFPILPRVEVFNNTFCVVTVVFREYSYLIVGMSGNLKRATPTAPCRHNVIVSVEPALSNGKDGGEPELHPLTNLEGPAVTMQHRFLPPPSSSPSSAQRQLDERISTPPPPPIADSSYYYNPNHQNYYNNNSQQQQLSAIEPVYPPAAAKAIKAAKFYHVVTRNNNSNSDNNSITTVEKSLLTPSSSSVIGVNYSPEEDVTALHLRRQDHSRSKSGGFVSPATPNDIRFRKPGDAEREERRRRQQAQEEEKREQEEEARRRKKMQLEQKDAIPPPPPTDEDAAPIAVRHHQQLPSPSPSSSPSIPQQQQQASSSRRVVLREVETQTIETQQQPTAPRIVAEEEPRPPVVVQAVPSSSLAAKQQASQQEQKPVVEDGHPEEHQQEQYHPPIVSSSRRFSAEDTLSLMVSRLEAFSSEVEELAMFFGAKRQRLFVMSWELVLMSKQSSGPTPRKSVVV